jgi:hypothetical protein
MTVVDRDKVVVPYDPHKNLWELALVTDSTNLELDDRLQLVIPPLREATSPVQSRKGLEREDLARTWRSPMQTVTNSQSLPCITKFLPFETQRDRPDPPPRPPKIVPAKKKKLTPSEKALAAEVRALEAENSVLRRHVQRQDCALVALAKLRHVPGAV